MRWQQALAFREVRRIISKVVTVTILTTPIDVRNADNYNLTCYGKWMHLCLDGLADFQ